MAEPATAPPRARTAIDAIVTHHRDVLRSGVARFNELLAERLRVPLLGVSDREVESTRCALLSFKVAELADSERELLRQRLERMAWRGDVFLHEYGGLDLERWIVAHASRIYCGNEEIRAQVEGHTTAWVDDVWAPSLIVDARPYEPAEIGVFSFGMAHKIQTGHFRHLRDLLEASGRSFAVYVSAANHETASLRDAELVFGEMHEIFPRLYFLGNLSDVAVSNELRRATFFAAFFPRGVRANNTSVAAAMELGAVVITNLDRYSPSDLVHMKNVIDLRQCESLPTDPLDLERLRGVAAETVRRRDWDALVARLT